MNKFMVMPELLEIIYIRNVCKKKYWRELGKTCNRGKKKSILDEIQGLII